MPRRNELDKRVESLLLARRVSEIEAALGVEQADHGVTLINSVHHFNIVRYRRRFFVLDQDLGEVDVTSGPELLAKQYGADAFFIADSETEARLRIDLLLLTRRVAELEARTVSIRHWYPFTFRIRSVSFHIFKGIRVTAGE